MGFGLFDDSEILLHTGDEATGEIVLGEFALPLLAEACGAEFFGDVEELEEAVFAQGGGDEGVVGGVVVGPHEAGVPVPEGAAVGGRGGG